MLPQARIISPPALPSYRPHPFRHHQMHNSPPSPPNPSAKHTELTLPCRRPLSQHHPAQHHHQQLSRTLRRQSAHQRHKPRHWHHVRLGARAAAVPVLRVVVRVDALFRCDSTAPRATTCISAAAVLRAALRPAIPGPSPRASLTTPEALKTPPATCCPFQLDSRVVACMAAKAAAQTALSLPSQLQPP